MGRLTLRTALAGLVVAWGLGTLFFPLGGMIHFLLIALLIVWIVDRVGRTR